MNRRSMTVRLQLTLSYAGFLLVAGLALCAVAVFFLLRYIPEGHIVLLNADAASTFVPDRWDLLRAFLPAASQVLGFLAVIGVAGGWLLAGRVLRHLPRISQAARLAAAGSLGHRINLGGPRDEFRELADVFDAMLERLEAQVGEQQRFAANASHELRTPLTVTRTLLEVAQASPDADLDELLDRLRQINERAIDVTESLLLLSRIDHEPLELEPVDLAAVVEDAAGTLQGCASGAGVELRVTATPTQVLGHSELLGRLAANLIHNAIVHNRTEEQAAVWVRTEPSPDGGATLTVENTGDVLAPRVIANLTEPFERGTRRARRAGRDHRGAGLGLAICNSIVRVHGGQLVLEARGGGGLLVRTTLPPHEQGQPSD